MASLETLVKPVLQISISHLHPTTIANLEEQTNAAEYITYYKKDIGEEHSVGYFIVCNEESLRTPMPDDLRLVMTLGASLGVYYVELDEMFEESNLLPVYSEA